MSWTIKKTSRTFQVFLGLVLSVNAMVSQAEEIITTPIRTFTGHTSYDSVAYSPDGQRALSGSYDNTLKLWDVNTGAEPRTFTGHTDWVTSVAFSPDGQRALSGSDDKTMRLWDVNTGGLLRTFTGHTWSVYSVAYSPDGQRALSGSYKKMKLWDVNTGAELRTFTGHTGSVKSVAYSPDGQRALSGSGDYTVKLWDINTGAELRTFKGHSSNVYSVAYSPDGQRALSGSGDKTMKLWDLGTEPIIVPPITEPVEESMTEPVVEPPPVVVENVAPTVSGDLVIELAITATTYIALTTADLNTTDDSSATNQLIYTVKNIDNVTVKKYELTSSSTVNVGGTFTQAQIDSGTIKVLLTDKTLDGNFTFTVKDSVGKMAVNPVDSTNTFTFTVTSDSDGYTTPIDETPVVEPPPVVVVNTAQESVTISNGGDSPPPSTTSEIATVTFSADLQRFYEVGETVRIELIETVSRDKYTRVDLWVAIDVPESIGGGMLFRTGIPLKQWDSAPQPHKTSVENTETSHYIFDFEVPEGMGGEYTLYAAYVEEGKDPTQENGLFYLISNLAKQKITLSNSK
jgi:WD40 repeat protein